MLLSVVIIGRNEGDRLIRCIKSARTAVLPIESNQILYIDSLSKDKSVTLAMQAGVDDVFILEGPKLNAALARNRGLAESTGEFVLFLDGDTILNPDFLPIAMKELDNDPQLGIVYGHRREQDLSSLYNRVSDLDWGRDSGKTETAAGDILCRREIMEDIGGYDGSLIAGEDPEMANRMINAGYDILHIDVDMVVHDLGLDSFQSYWKHAIRSGYAYAAVADRTRNRRKPLWQKLAVKNYLQGLAYTLTLPMFFLSYILLNTWWVAVVVSVLATAVILRTVKRNKLKEPSIKWRLLYAVHSHFLKIPIMLGQLKYKTRKASEILEYKDR